MEFLMSDDEEKAAKEWFDLHLKTKHKGKAPYTGAAGGGLSYEFTPTGIGTCIVVRCMCGAEENVTDFEGW